MRGRRRSLFLLGLSGSALFAACSDARRPFPSDPAPAAAPAPTNECARPIYVAGASAENAPALRVLGAAVVEHPLDEAYEDAGASAESPAEGDLSSQIVVSGLDGVDVHQLGDYLIRYSVSSRDGRLETQAARLVRVTDGLRFARQTARLLGTTESPLGYFEHLPVAYAHDESTRFPLLVFNHGVGEAYNWAEQDADVFGHSPQRLDRLLRRGLTALLATDDWDDGLPFVALSPQRCLLDTATEVAYLHAFVAYAERSYRIDPAHIYMIGFSAGSFITWEYTVRHSEELAAIVHISGGDSELAGCPRQQPPTWAFHARDDETVPLDEDLRTLQAIDACSPASRVKVTVLPHGGHLIDQGVLDGSVMAQAEPGFDPYDQNLYAWLLQH